MRRDTVVGLVGAVILLVALIGVFRYESVSGPGGLTYGLAAPKALAPFDGTAAQGQSYNANVPVQEPNLTRMDFTLEASAGTFNLTVKDPSGQVRAAQGEGTIHVSFPVAPPPENGTSQPPAPAGQGNWTVTVTLVQAPSSNPVPATVPLVGQQNGVSFRVTPYAIDYEAK